MAKLHVSSTPVVWLRHSVNPASLIGAAFAPNAQSVTNTAFVGRSHAAPRRDNANCHFAPLQKIVRPATLINYPKKIATEVATARAQYSAN